MSEGSEVRTVEPSEALQLRMCGADPVRRRDRFVELENDDSIVVVVVVVVDLGCPICRPVLIVRISACPAATTTRCGCAS